MVQPSGAQEFFRPGGSLGPNHPSYIDRAADRDLYAKLITGECTCVLNARQMGKTSLKNAAKEKLLAQGILLISADLALIGGQLEPDQWYCSLLQEFVRGLRDHDIRPAKSVRTFWLENNHWSPAYRFLRGVEELLLRSALPEVSGADLEVPQQPKSDGGDVRLILAIDEIDKVRDFAGGWSDDFFAAIRAFYESRPFNPLKSGAGFLLIGVAPPSDLSKGPNSTPFNIGHRIVLTDFTRDEARKLEKGFLLAGQSPVRAEALLDSVMHYTGGHPYLTQRLCYEAALMLGQEGAEGARAREVRPSKLIEQACRHCFLDPGIGNNRSDDNLRNVHIQLTKRLEDDRYIISHLPDQADLGLENPSTAEKREERKAAVLKLYGDVRRGRSVRDDFRSNPWVGYLHFAGVVRSDHGQLRVRNRVYEKVFNRHWVQENMPGRFKRAERTAFYRGLATASAFALLVVIGGLLWWKQHTEWRIRQAEASLRKADDALEDFDRIPAAMAELSKAAKYHPDPKLVADTFIQILSRDTLQKVEPSETNLSPKFRSWNAAALTRLKLAPPGFALEWVDFSADGRYAAGIHKTRESCVLTVKRVSDAAEVISSAPCCNASVTFDPAGNRLAFLSTNGIARVISLADGRELRASQALGISADPFSSHRLDFNPRKPWLAITSPARDEVRIWNLESNQMWKPLRPERAMSISDLDWDDQGNRLAVIGGESSQVAIWDFQFDQARPAANRFDARTPLSSVQFLPQSQTLAGFGPAGSLFLWNTDGSLLYDKPVPEDSGAGSRLVSVENGTVGLVGTKATKLWRFKPSPIARSVPLTTEPEREIAGMDFDAAGRLLLVASGSWLTLIDARNGVIVERLSLKENVTIQDAFFTPKHSDLVVLAEDGLYRWKSHVTAGESGMEYRFTDAGRLPRARGITAAALSPDESQIALSHPSAGKQGLHVDLVDLRRSDWHRLPSPTNWSRWLGQKLLPGSSESVREIRKLSFSPDQSVLLGYSSESGQLLRWNLSEQGALNESAEREDAFGFGFSPDGRWLITVDRVSAQCRSVPGLEEGFRLPRPYHSNFGVLLAMAALPGEEFLLAQPTDSHSVGIFKLTPGAKQIEDLAELSVPGGARIRGLHFSEDGSLLAVLTDNDGTYSVQLWRLDQISQLGREVIGTSPFLKLRLAAQTSTRLKARFDPASAQSLNQGRDRTRYFEHLEMDLRHWVSVSANPNATNEQKAALKGIAQTAAILEQSEWEGHFSIGVGD